MRTSTKQAITFLGLGIAVLLGCIILAQRGRNGPVDYTARKAHIHARQIVPTKGMETILAGPMIRGEDTEQIEKKKGKSTIPLGTVSTDSSPPRMIFLDSFLLDATEVTNKAYRDAVEAGLVTPPSGKASVTREDYFSNPRYDNYPVVNVSWLQARLYCESKGKRLPTETEWEKAARARDARLWTWGDTWEKHYANTLEAAKGDTTAVKEFPRDRSLYSVMDLIGNVREWVADWYAPEFYASSATSNPIGPPEGIERVVRGGSFRSSIWDARIAHRGHLPPETANAWTGFRCAQDALPRWKAERIKAGVSSQPREADAVSKKHGRMRIDQPAYCFGKIWEGDPVEHTFRIQNTGDGPLRILDTQAKCGCTTLGDVVGVVEPGETWRLPVRVKTNSGNGLTSRGVYLATDDPVQPYASLYLYGEIRRKIEAEPHFVDFRNLKPDEVREKTITLTNNTNEPIRLNTPAVSDDWFEAELTENQAGRRWTLTVRTKPPLSYGSLVGKVTIGTSLNRPNPFEIRVSGRVPARVVVRPMSVIVESPSDSDIVRRVQIIQTEGGQIKLAGVRTDHDGIEATIETPQGRSAVVAIKVVAGTRIPDDGATVWIETDDPEFPKLKVRVLNKPARSSPLPFMRLKKNVPISKEKKGE